MHRTTTKLLQENQKDLQKTLPHLSYPEIIAESLVSFSKQNPSFQAWFRTFALTFPEIKNAGAKISTNSHPFFHPNFSKENFFLPNGFEAAVERAHFLKQIFTDNPSLQTQKAAQMLAGWIEDAPLEVPRVQVIGLIIGWVIGPDFGRFRKKKKMHYIGQKSFYRKTNVPFARAVSEANATVLRKAFDRADGKAQKLEPEIGDWLYGERGSLFYEASEKTIREIIREIRKFPIPYALIRHHDRPDLLAIAPSVNESVLENFSGIKPHEDPSR